MDPRTLLRAQLSDQSLRSLARKMRISAAYLSDVLTGKMEPGPKILNYLGLERVELPAVYRQKPRQKKLSAEARP